MRPAVRAPTARYNIKLRAGRGFTLEELKAVGLTRQRARQIGVTVDHRRRNRSQESLDLNVARLKAYTEKVVVFPLHKGKSKKGDSTGADLEATEFARDMRKAFPIPASSVHESPRAITQEERDFSAHEALRMARANARQVGPRKVRYVQSLQSLLCLYSSYLHLCVLL